MSAGAAAPGHSLTRLGHEERRHARHDATLPCRLSFTRTGLHDVGSVLAVTRNVSRSGALVIVQRPIDGVAYVNVDFGAGIAPLAAIVRHRCGADLGVEFFSPIDETMLAALLAAARRSGGQQGTGT